MKTLRIAQIALAIAVLMGGIAVSTVHAVEAPVAASSETAPTEPKIETVMRSVTGEVSGVSGGFIAILFGVGKETSYEMAFNLDKDVKVVHKESLKDIAQGDTVSVSYEETTRTKEGEKPRVMARVVKEISFISAAKKAPEAGALVTKE